MRRADGSTYTTTGTLGQRIALLDFSNPRAVAFWKRELAKMFDYGFDGFHADFGEEVMFDMHFADGESGRTMHNRYTVLYQMANRAAIVAYERTHPHRQLWFFNRDRLLRESRLGGVRVRERTRRRGDELGSGRGAALARAGHAQPGDRGRVRVRDRHRRLLRLHLTGDDEGALLRWAEWAALTPVFRLHGSGRAGTHTPWSYDAQTVQIYEAISRLHERAAALILKLWKLADRTGIPPTRPLWLAFGGDRRAAAQQQEWMLGPDVLVAPVVTERATTRVVYFPTGCWRDPQTGRTYHGRRSATVSAPLAAPAVLLPLRPPAVLGPRRLAELDRRARPA